MKMYDDVIVTAKSTETLQAALVAGGFASVAERDDADAGSDAGDFIAGDAMLPIRPVWHDDAAFDDEGAETTPATQRFAAYTCLRLPAGTDVPVMDGVTVAPWEPGLPGWGDNPDVPAPDMDALRRDARKAVLAFADKIASRLTDGYPDAERASWVAKQAEARAIVAGEADPAAYPVIAAEIALTGRDAAELAPVILAKASVYERAAGMISGLRQATLAAVDAAVSAEEIAAVLASAKAQAEAKFAELTGG